MNGIMRFINSSIVKKQLMACTGLLLCGFLISHLLGNIFIAVSPDAFNLYAHKLTSNPLIYLAEAGLATIFLVHLILAARLTLENKKARGTNYVMKVRTGRGATFASSTMIYTGLVILVFLVLHILHFKFGTMYETQVDGETMRDLHRTVFEYFAQPLAVLWYVVAMSCVGIHVAHGLQSALQSLGINHPKYNCLFKCGGKLFAAGVAVGFSSLAIYCHLAGGQ